MQPDDPKLGRFYLLPKIQKRFYRVPGRPIISNSGYFTENISAFVDHHLQPLATTVKSYIKDTNDFLRKIKGFQNITEDTILCSIDVVGLYPNIPHDEGLKALEKKLNERQNPKIPTETLVKMADLVLKNNVFLHNGKTYRQKRGTAMGTKKAPPYAIIFMGDFEENALNGYNLKPSAWLRYIDDIFLLWEHGEEELIKFIDYLNAIHPTIKFTFSYSRTSIDFLDVRVSKDGTGLKTDLFIKPTDTHQYLHHKSCHPYHTKRGIPYGQALRYRRIISDDLQLGLESEKLVGYLIDRGFPENMVREQVNRAILQNRDTLLDSERPPRDVTSRPICVLTYHPAYGKKVFDIFKELHPMLTSDAEHARVFSELPLVAYRRPKNLCDSLVRAMLPNNSGSPGCDGCHGDKRCQCCDIIVKSDSFTSTSTGRRFEIRAKELNCNSRGVVYLLECKTCGIQNVGSTWPVFRFRANNYRKDQKNYVKRKNGDTLGRGPKVPQAALHAHFAQDNHNGFADFSFKLIDHAQSEEDLRQREAFWQYRLATFVPQGLNIRDVPFRLDVNTTEPFQ